MIKKHSKAIGILLFAVVTLLLTTIGVHKSLAGGCPWKNHSQPYTFMFGNHIDTHQQTEQNNGKLFGFLYVTFTGDDIDGIPILDHCDGNTPANECEEGWIIRGKPGEAKFVFHDNVNKDHPIWIVESRNDIPQPGSFSHFHWLDGPAGAGDLIPGQFF